MVRERIGWGILGDFEEWWKSQVDYCHEIEHVGMQWLDGCWLIQARGTRHGSRVLSRIVLFCTLQNKTKGLLETEEIDRSIVYSNEKPDAAQPEPKGKEQYCKIVPQEPIVWSRMGYCIENGIQTDLWIRADSWEIRSGEIYHWYKTIRIVEIESNQGCVQQKVVGERSN